jgi:hypothetical protein
MGNAISRLTPAQETVSANRRKITRLAVQAVAQLCSLDGENVRVAIGDLSAHGCSVRCVSGWLRAGRFVSIGIADEPPLRAVVRWVRDDLAGLEFLRPVPSDRSEWHALMGSSY